MKKLLFILIFLTPLFASHPVNGIYLKDLSLLDKKDDLLKLSFANKIFLATYTPCKADFTKLCFVNKDYKNASLSSSEQGGIKFLQEKGVKIYFTFSPNADFYKAVARNPRLYKKLALSIKEFVKDSGLNGMEFFYNPPRLVRKLGLKEFLKTLKKSFILYVSTPKNSVKTLQPFLKKQALIDAVILDARDFEIEDALLTRLSRAGVKKVLLKIPALPMTPQMFMYKAYPLLQKSLVKGFVSVD